MSSRPDLMTPAEVAALFGVRPTTVLRWADQGHLPCVRTPGGHRRYHRDDIHTLINDLTPPPAHEGD